MGILNQDQFLEKVKSFVSNGHRPQNSIWLTVKSSVVGSKQYAMIRAKTSSKRYSTLVAKEDVEKFIKGLSDLFVELEKHLRKIHVAKPGRKRVNQIRILRKSRQEMKDSDTEEDEEPASPTDA
ncbi:signal recognition particle 14 kDa protein [Gregarina niphandrodes]|uniref:Signal recognition particle 14 kDa protein n=1 Tax=Gregarina niphandrodes TaxID=110365 RepID=A0A023B263_GRENI|nr:signal recognition particle 14 kDa protein [Gregarina niphandrodes]EZG48581.1 signal recognition particle 14 kDa protein [Gregarina niphandrodes]|eukprot:XP_011132085.1 signal recognition particle 14 kDa protein [Gregarina niphandrodes]